MSSESLERAGIGHNLQGLLQGITMKRSLSAIILAICLAWNAPVLAQPPVNLNTASPSELTSIKGIGPAKAQAIIEYREKHGPFKSVADLDNVKSFGPKTIEKIAPQVTVGLAAAPDRKWRSQSP